MVTPTKDSHPVERPINLLQNSVSETQQRADVATTIAVVPCVSTSDRLLSTPVVPKETIEMNVLEKLTTAERIAAIDTLLAHAATEQEIYWQRSMIFLTLNSIMIGFAATQKIHPLEILILMAFGLYFNKAWRNVLINGQFFADRWKHDARAIAASDETLLEAYRALSDKARIERPREKKPSRIMKEISFLFQAAWLGLGLYGTSDVWLNTLRRALSGLLNAIK